MAIAPYLPPEEVRPYFRKMKELFEELKEIKQHNVQVEFCQWVCPMTIG